MTGSECETLVTVRGIVVPQTWTDDGTVTAVAISSFDESEFSISSPFGLGEWLSLLRKEVEVVGVVTGTQVGSKAIKVCDFRVIPGEDQDEAD
jgi:hypothetical protein